MVAPHHYTAVSHLGACIQMQQERRRENMSNMCYGSKRLHSLVGSTFFSCLSFVFPASFSSLVM